MTIIVRETHESHSVIRHDQRLGRHVEHHSASTAYAFHVAPKSALRSVVWQRRIPILDQGNLGSCTANALTGLLGTDSQGRTATTSVVVTADLNRVFKAGSYVLDEAFAVEAYKLNTWLDNIPGQYPPSDTGSSGVACGKTGQQLGLFASYKHAFSYQSAITALQTGPILVGVPWYNSMFDPSEDGEIVVDTASGLAGGHELMAREYDAPNDRVWLDNSWGESWGVSGRAWVSGATLTGLLADQGDVTVPVFANVPPGPAVDVNTLAAYRSLQSWAVANNIV